MSRLLTDLDPSIRPRAERFLAKCRENGVDVVVTETLRTAARQNYLYSLGRTVEGKIVTNARGTPAESIHQFGLAFDIAVKVDGKITWDSDLYEQVGPWGEEEGLAWGGRWKFKDYPHYEYRGGLTFDELRRGKRPPLA